MSQILVGDDLHKSFGLTQALRGASIVLDEGEIVAVMGPSGSGKSTLMNLLGCLDTPTSGSVVIEGVDLTAASLPERARVRPRESPLPARVTNPS